MRILGQCAAPCAYQTFVHSLKSPAFDVDRWDVARCARVHGRRRFVMLARFRSGRGGSKADKTKKDVVKVPIAPVFQKAIGKSDLYVSRGMSTIIHPCAQIFMNFLSHFHNYHSINMFRLYMRP